jgi:uncharacterized membrane-anchored protein YhcB (DUF1043 family)
MKREGQVLVMVSLLVGVAVGVAASQMKQGSLEEQRNYCATVEEGIQQNMSEGFVNCVTSWSFSANLSEDVSQGSELECLCRKKVGNRIQQLKIRTSE